MTNVDLAVDRMLVEELRAARPHDAILSEESGLHGSGERGWILDPIDGTFNLVRDHADWGTHIALEIGGEIAVGVVTRPMLDAVLVGDALAVARSARMATGRRRLNVSACADLAGAQIRLWNDDVEDAARIRGATTWTDADMNDILDVAEGRCDAVLGVPGEIWDHAPNVLIVEEAGGRFHDERGGRRIDLGRGRFTNGAVDAALDALLAR